ncbi:hypothetical protein ACLK1T_20525 [Escherichia coli]
MDGMQLFAEIQNVQPGMPVIILTAHGLFPMLLLQHSRAFLVSSPSLSIKMRYIRRSTMRWTIHASHHERWREAIVTRSPLMLRLLEQARLVAQSDVAF